MPWRLGRRTVPYPSPVVASVAVRSSRFSTYVAHRHGRLVAEMKSHVVAPVRVYLIRRPKLWLLRQAIPIFLNGHLSRVLPHEEDVLDIVIREGRTEFAFLPRDSGQNVMGPLVRSLGQVVDADLCLSKYHISSVVMQKLVYHFEVEGIAFYA